MPVDIVSVGSSPFKIFEGDVEVTLETQPRLIHTAIEAALNHAELCKCDVTLSQDYRLRVEWSPLVESDGVQCTNKHLITWAEPTSRSDGSELSSDEIANYKVYRAVELDGVEIQYDVFDAGKNLQYLINTPAFLYKYTVQTVDGDGAESDLSSEVTLGGESE